MRLKPLCAKLFHPLRVSSSSNLRSCQGYRMDIKGRSFLTETHSNGGHISTQSKLVPLYKEHFFRLTALWPTRLSPSRWWLSSPCALPCQWYITTLRMSRETCTTKSATAKPQLIPSILKSILFAACPLATVPPVRPDTTPDRLLL